MVIFSKEKFEHGLKHYIFTTAIIWLAILFYRYNPYYKALLRPETQATLLYLALSYTAISLLTSIILPIEKTKNSKTLILARALKRIGKESYHYLKNFARNPSHPSPKMEKHEKITLLFLIVKLFFLPLMLNFFFGNLAIVREGAVSISSSRIELSIEYFNVFVYPLLFSFLFVIDTLYFSFGYAFEAEFLNNKVRSVEPTVFGWFVALISYPPFNGLFAQYTTWYANDNINFWTPEITFVMRLFILFLLGIYVWASIALGTKCSNLTNRGIVSRGPYRFIRHPAYISKNLIWWLTLLPVMALAAFLSMFVWSVIYYFRAITEERHLIQDSDYQEYCKKVKYRFIPYIW